MRDVLEVRFDLTSPTQGQMRELVADLSEEERHLLLEHGEEAPFCGVFLHERREGLYTCRLCGLPLFRAVAKFESGTGWPSFTAPSLKNIFGKFKIRDMAWSERRSFAPDVARIKVTSFRTARLRLESVFA